MRSHLASVSLVFLFVACVPPGTGPTSDAGATSAPRPAAAQQRSKNQLATVFEDNFDRVVRDASVDDASTFLLPTLGAPDAADLRVTGRLRGGARHDAARGDGAPGPALLPEASTAFVPPRDDSNLGPSWRQAQTNAWRVENGRLCGQNAKNHGVWFTREIPVNARIEFDAISDSTDGDLKAELWGDGQSAATTISYENATSYLTILGGWKNTLHVLARINEHGEDRKVIRVDKTSDDARQRPVNRGQTYRFKIERNDGATIRWFVDGLEYLSYHDAEPLTGPGHDHFGFNDWEARVCFDNVKVTPLP